MIWIFEIFLRSSFFARSGIYWKYTYTAEVLIYNFALPWRVRMKERNCVCVCMAAHSRGEAGSSSGRSGGWAVERHRLPARCYLCARLRRRHFASLPRHPPTMPHHPPPPPLPPCRRRWSADGPLVVLQSFTGACLSNCSIIIFSASNAGSPAVTYM